MALAVCVSKASVDSCFALGAAPLCHNLVINQTTPIACMHCTATRTWPTAHHFVPPACTPTYDTLPTLGPQDEHTTIEAVRQLVDTERAYVQLLAGFDAAAAQLQAAPDTVLATSMAYFLRLFDCQDIKSAVPAMAGLHR